MKKLIKLFYSKISTLIVLILLFISFSFIQVKTQFKPTYKAVYIYTIDTTDLSSANTNSLLSYVFFSSLFEHLQIDTYVSKDFAYNDFNYDQLKSKIKTQFNVRDDSINISSNDIKNSFYDKKNKRTIITNALDSSNIYYSPNIKLYRKKNKIEKEGHELDEWILLTETDKFLKVYTSKKIPKEINMGLNIDLPNGVFMIKQNRGLTIKLDSFQKIDTLIAINYPKEFTQSKFYSFIDTLSRGSLEFDLK